MPGLDLLLQGREAHMAGKVLVNLATGMEDAERVTVASLVATAALDKGKSVVIWATKHAVRLAPRARRRVKHATAARPGAAIPAVHR